MPALRPVVLPVIMLLLVALPATAHEFWISPEAYVITSGEKVKAHLRVGQKFRGSGYSYNPRQFERFEIITQNGASPVPGRLGDMPPLNMGVPDGLIILVHETTDNILKYSEWEKFKAFVEHKDFPTVLADHIARGLPEKGFREKYRRYAKSLVAVGDGVGADKPVGLKTEIVALANPYRDTLEMMPVSVLLDGIPRPNAQVELFDRAPDGTVTVTLYRTDNSGRAEFPVTPGHEYLVDAVVMEPLEHETGQQDPVWWSLWASLTFQIPDPK